MLRSFLIAFSILAMSPAICWAQVERTHDITIDDYFSQSYITSQQISPDGKVIAFSLATWQKSTNDRRSDLWLVWVTENGTPRRLTFDRANDRNPQWFRGQIYFLGNRKKEGEKAAPYDGSSQVWRVDERRGSPQPITRVPGGVQAFAIHPNSLNSATLFYVDSAKQVSGPLADLKNQFADIDYGHGVVQASRIWQMDIVTFQTKKIIDTKRVISEMSLAPNGKRIAIVTTPDGTVVSAEGKSRVDVVDVATGNLTTIPDTVYRDDVPSPYGWIEHLAWSPDSNTLAFNIIFDAYPSEVVVANLKDNEVKLAKRPSDVSLRGYGCPIAFLDQKTISFLGDQKGRTRLYTMGDNAKTLTPGDVVVDDFSVSSNGKRIAMVMQNTKHTPDLYVMDVGKEPFRVTNINPQVDTWKLPQISTVSWKAADGTTVEGILELPPDYKQGQKLPLVVVIHGGPTTCSQYKLMYWIYGRTLLAAKGYAVLAPNYRGSTGYGDKFLTDLVGRENDLDVGDILSGVDMLVKKGIADPARMAVSGWSNGGYLTNCIISRTNRFRAAISGAGIVDAVTEFGTSDEPAYTIVFKKGFPWTAAENYHRASSTYSLNKIRTPTLIHVGANDERCPPGHSRMLYRVLKQYNNVPTELLVYPGEGHGLMTYNHRRGKMVWDLAWLERYVLQKK